MTDEPVVHVYEGPDKPDGEALLGQLYMDVPAAPIVFCAKSGCHEPTRFMLEVAVGDGPGDQGDEHVRLRLCPDHIAEFLRAQRIVPS